MRNAIKRILIEFLKHKIIVSSWGIENITIGDNCIHFCVNGFRYCGRINIYAKQGKFYIELGKSLRFSRISLNSIVQTLDSIIEKDDKYTENLCSWIEKTTQGT